MCRSAADGGQRCAAHTRAAYERATIGTPEWDEAATDYASTPEGRDAIGEAAITAHDQGDPERAAALMSARTRGAARRQANTETAARIAEATGTPRPAGFTPFPANHHWGLNRQHCRGTNHTDEGTYGECDGCGTMVVKVTGGKTIKPIPNDRGGFKFSCWADQHICDPELADHHTRQRAERIAAGQLLKGATVTVTRGRKIPHGTTGVIAWKGDNGYGESVGLRIEGQDNLVFVASKNCDATGH